MKVFDGHSDIFSDITERYKRGECDILRKYHLNELNYGNVKTMILCIWIETLYENDMSHRLLEIMAAIQNEIKYLDSFGGIIYSYDDMVRLNKEDKLGIIIGTEGFDGIRDNVNLIDFMYNFGVRHGMLTWNRDNAFATSCATGHEDRGLTRLGIEAVKKMEKLGMIVDVSHANEKSFWDIYNNTKKPFIASHSNTYKLCKSPRNLKDDQLKAIAERNGVVGINTWPDFICKGELSIEALAAHVDYMVDIMGINHVGFGFDFGNYLDKKILDAMGGEDFKSVPHLENASQINNLISVLKNKGYNNEDIEKIAYKNMERIVKEIL